MLNTNLNVLLHLYTNNKCDDISILYYKTFFIMIDQQLIVYIAKIFKSVINLKWRNRLYVVTFLVVYKSEYVKCRDVFFFYHRISN